MELPWLPDAQIVTVPGRGEFFVRFHRHADPATGVVMLLHGWTASADLQFFTAYETLVANCTVVAIDHRGHGRGLRTSGGSFTIEDAADDAVLVARALGVDQAILVGYSMGGPIALTASHRHPGFATGLVVQATALEWNATWRERFTWRMLPFMGAMLRSWMYPRSLRRSLPRLIPSDHQLDRYRDWILGEMERTDPYAVVQAGRALAHFDARAWASSLGLPAAMLLTTSDRLVKPRKQRQLADALGAHVIEIPGDHLVAWERPDEFSRHTQTLVDHVHARTRPAPA